MATDIKIPSLGESLREGTIARWLKKDGEFVERDEPLFELETEKATTEVPAPASGTLHIGTHEGETVAVGATIGRIDEAKAPAKKPPAKADQQGNGREEKLPAAAPAPKPREHPSPPSVRRLAREHEVDLSQVEGTGKGGRVTAQDVLRHAEKETSEVPAPTSPAPVAEEAEAQPPAGERREAMSAIRQRIAERLLTSQKATATLTTFNEADLSAVLEWRRRNRERFREVHGVDLGLMPFFVKASSLALREHPVVNAWIEGKEIVHHADIHIGVAVSTEKGLMVPVLRHADRMSFAAIEKQLAALVEKARAGKISIEDLQGGTFTITNGGVFGSMLSTPILNPPQSAILGMHAIQKRPVVVDDQIVIRPMMYLALSYDHRLIDGRDAVRFLVRIKEYIEQPERMLLQV